MKKFWANVSSNAKKNILCAAIVGALTAGELGGAVAFHALGPTINNLMGEAKTSLVAVYNGLLGIVTVLAVVICGWCFMVKMFSKNPRSIDEATQWIKRVAIAWLCFMLLSVFVNIGADLVSQSGANTSNPWG